MKHKRQKRSFRSISLITDFRVWNKRYTYRNILLLKMCFKNSVYSLLVSLHACFNAWVYKQLHIIPNSSVYLMCTHYCFVHTNKIIIKGIILKKKLFKFHMIIVLRQQLIFCIIISISIISLITT